MDDDGTLAIATPEAAAAMAFARELVADGVAPARRARRRSSRRLFNEGKAATVMSGPWFVADIDKGVPWEVAHAADRQSATGKPRRAVPRRRGRADVARARTTRTPRSR